MRKRQTHGLTPDKLLTTTTEQAKRIPCAGAGDLNSDIGVVTTGGSLKIPVKCTFRQFNVTVEAKVSSLFGSSHILAC